MVNAGDLIVLQAPLAHLLSPVQAVILMTRTASTDYSPPEMDTVPVQSWYPESLIKVCSPVGHLS